jgi:hypothetical protein
MTSPPNYQRATRETIESLQMMADSLSLQRLTKLSLPEIEAVVVRPGLASSAATCRVRKACLEPITAVGGRFQSILDSKR